jgi:ATP-dependent DNA helicase RecG
VTATKATAPRKRAAGRGTREQPAGDAVAPAARKTPAKKAAGKAEGQTAVEAAPKAPPANSAARKLAKLGLRRPEDFLLHLPLRFEDETTVTPIADLSPGEHQQVEGVITDSEVKYKPRRQLVLALRDDAGDSISLRFLNFYGSQVQAWGIGTRIRARGEVRGGFWGCEMVHPGMKRVGEDTALPTTLTPVYPASAGVPQGLIRKGVDRALTHYSDSGQPDYLPDAWRERLKLPTLAASLRLLHHPSAEVSAGSLEGRTHPAWQRIKFDELLAQQLSLKRAVEARRIKNAPRLTDVAGKASLTAQLIARLPFKLTGAQARVWREIAADLAQPYPMHRLLQGDVGSGKTIVAALACLHAIDNGFQAALMAPTEILAEQHFRKIADLIAPLGVPVAWLTGSLKTRAKREAQAAVSSGAARLVIGTHALIQEKVEFERLGLAVIDEQHRFGVGQRLELRTKSAQATGMEPHILAMSATPIPRTLAMTYYADLDVSVIDEMPPGRTPIVTKVFAMEKKDEVIERVRQWASEGGAGQVYWVVPLVEESEMLELQNALDAHAQLSEELAPIPVGLVHGRLTPAEKQAVMDEFVAGRVRVLVATTVIEVGVDVPAASLMVIEHAERFGLAQLHQLRGRVGRGAAESVCVLLYASPLSPTAKERLKVMRETTDGFEIARRDLQLRGPGEFLGSRQSGLALLRFADLEEDQAWVAAAQDCATDLLAHDPHAVQECLRWWMGGREHYLKA